MFSPVVVFAAGVFAMQHEQPAKGLHDVSNVWTFLALPCLLTQHVPVHHPISRLTVSGSCMR